MSDASLAARTVSAAGARAALDAAQRHAAGLGRAVGVAVVDSSGAVVAAARMDGAPTVALALATDKAWTAAAFDAPSDAFGEESKPDGVFWGLASSLQGRFCLLAGGLPLADSGAPVGAVGVSGGTAEEDRAIAAAAAAALVAVGTAPAPPASTPAP